MFHDAPYKKEPASKGLVAGGLVAGAEGLNAPVLLKQAYNLFANVEQVDCSMNYGSRRLKGCIDDGCGCLRGRGSNRDGFLCGG